ncbi:heterotrimeric G-protein alpha subunit, GPA3-like protein [Mycotypha africana]|uniref:heterotrimeric G-protein alpha subunit, GPA3-like protein n=1 Tax=Mycotypha africana TaxID=64632 RepID=UPI0023008BDD|nr:heterotrimeric G-protein alpha subunit, GPA3-like protein [Mycotypha africana]KAI8966921.1 heterotrimeric G-protein alpha subunit, GPA3-like protein [Mycotypha africana]
MGACISSEERAEKSHSFNIDKLIEEDGKKMEKEFKILLLGSGESGKSTIFKQMKIIHQNGYSREELLNWKLTVYRNLIQSAQAIVKALRQFEYQLDSEKLEYQANQILDYKINTTIAMTTTTTTAALMQTDINNINDMLDPSFVDAVISVWNDPAVASLMDMRSTEFYLMDNASYFFDEIKRIGQPGYVPTAQDVLRARAKTTGIVETRFMIKETSIHMFDVGGQRSERKKWIHCFESVKSIIFCVSLSEYDQVLLEESRQNRMMESLVLFESVVNSRWFSRTTIILFLNKIDVFRKKIKKSPLERYFPDYGGGDDLNKAAKYILWRFNQTNRAKLCIYPHLTQATDTSNIAHVFNAIKDTIIQNHLKDSGIL